MSNYGTEKQSTAENEFSLKFKERRVKTKIKLNLCPELLSVIRLVIVESH